MNQAEIFQKEVTENISGLGNDSLLKGLSQDWLLASLKHKYSYNFSFLGRPIIQYPQDMVAMQELIWLVKPDLIIETGIAHGGSLIMSAAMLSLIEYCECVEQGSLLDPSKPQRKVLGIDIDIRSHNRQAIEDHPLSNRIEMLQGSSIAVDIIQQATQLASAFNRVLVCLDSNHTHEHVLAELQAYAPLVDQGSYCAVFDTVIADLPAEVYPDRPWGPTDNPKTAVYEFLKSNSDFIIDKQIDHKLQISVAPDGYLKRIRL